MPKKLKSIDPEVLASYGIPSFMDKVNAMLSGSKHKGAFPMPDSEFGQEGPLMHLFVSKMLKEWNRKRALEGRYGKNPDPKKFKQRLFDPEKTLDYGKKKTKMLKEAGKYDQLDDYKPVRPWDRREF